MMDAARNERQSWLHRQQAGYKLAALALAGGVLLWVHQWWVLSLALSGVMGLFAWSGVGFVRLWRQVKGLIWFVLLLGVYTALVQSPATAIEMLLRLTTLILAGVIVSMTTPVSQMMAVIEHLLQPLDRLGWVSASRVALACGLTLRLIPELTIQWKEIREAQLARGLKPGVLTMLVPMLVRTIRRAGEISEAVDARSCL